MSNQNDKESELSTLNDQAIRFYKDRFRLLLIIYSFSDRTEDEGLPLLLKGEIKIQAIDFFIRNPDYLAYELLTIASTQRDKLVEIKKIVQSIYHSSEPDVRRQEMEKFFYGAYEDIDDIIAFLCSMKLLKYESKLRVDMRVTEKHYYITKFAVERIETARVSVGVAKWYFERCEIINKYLGGTTGSELKARQYQIEQYSTTSYKDKIQQIDDLVIEKYFELYNEKL